MTICLRLKVFLEGFPRDAAMAGFQVLKRLTHADGDGSHLDFELDAEDDMVRLYSIVSF